MHAYAYANDIYCRNVNCETFNVMSAIESPLELLRVVVQFGLAIRVCGENSELSVS